MKIKEILNKLNKRFWAYIYLAVGRFSENDAKTVLFFTFQGEYTCNPKYICEALHKMNPEIRCVWVVYDEKSKKNFPEYAETVVFGSREYYRSLYRAKVWVDNAFNIVKQPVRKKFGQYYLETMHGSLGIKRIGPEANPDPKRNATGFRCGELSDYIISNSSFETMVYRTSFWKNTPVLELGHARNDILICNAHQDIEQELRKKVRRFYNIDENARLALYAPTFQRTNSGEYEALDPILLKNALEEKFGGCWYVLERLHPRDARKNVKKNTSAFVLNGNLYADIQELMAAIDFGMTDYSSWIYDYVLTKKPGFIYAPDLEKYRNSTGFYYPIETTPFPIAENNSQLKKCIENFSAEDYPSAVDEFLGDKGCIDDGFAAVKAAKAIIELLNDRKPENAYLEEN